VGVAQSVSSVQPGRQVPVGTSQRVPAPHWLSRVHSTQIVLPDITVQTGVVEVQPGSVPSPLSTHGAQIAPVPSGAHTPVLHGDPITIASWAQLPALHASVVHSSPSSHALELTQPAHTGTLPEVSQIGAPIPHPLSRRTPDASSTQVTHSGALGSPLHTPVGQIEPIG
jgi:hypothetical protein